MKKLITSAGLAAMGAAGLNAANIGDLNPDQGSKRWNVSAGLRGFYDDNYATRPAGPEKQGSGGVNFSPSASINFPLDQTYLSAAYTLSLLYYFDRPGDEIDQSHTVDVNVDHKFSERHRLHLRELFTYSKEPTLVDQGGPISVPIRTEADGIRNLLPIDYHWQLTRMYYVTLGYQNVYYHYFQDGDGSYGALLNRFEHLLRAELGYQLSENSSVLAGYQFGVVSYTSDDRLAVPDPNPFAPPPLEASIRDNRSHYLYLGYNQQFANNLSLDLRGGGVFTEYTEANADDVSPYFDLAMSYQYLPGNNLRIGLKQAHNATDQAGDGTSESLVTDQDTTTVYLAVAHRLTPKMTASANVQYQHSVFNGGSLDGSADDYLTAGVTLSYKFTQNWSAELEYDYDKLATDVQGREFSRNRVYGGVRFTF